MMESFSIYNACLRHELAKVHPLADLEPQNNEHGWHVSRNLRKPLNHLDFLRQKEEIAIELNLHNSRTALELFGANYEMLTHHQAGKISTKDVARHLATQCQLSEDDVTTRLREYAIIRHMEFHPSDVFNLTCCGCTYGHHDPKL